MAVPNTTTFTLDDVAQELGLGSGDSLQDCVDDAVSGDYDTDYYTAPATSLLEFRNYGGSTAVLTIAVSGNNFVVAGATALQNIQLEFEYISQTFTGTQATVTRSGFPVSAGTTTTMNLTGGPGSIWNTNAFTSPFFVSSPSSGIATITMGCKINSATVDSFPTGQVTVTQTFTIQ